MNILSDVAWLACAVIGLFGVSFLFVIIEDLFFGEWRAKNRSEYIYFHRELPPKNDWRYY